MGWLVSPPSCQLAVTTVVGWLGGLVVSHHNSNLAILPDRSDPRDHHRRHRQPRGLRLTTVLFPLLVVRLYRSMAGPGELRPAISTPGSLGDRASVRVPGKLVLAARRLRRRSWQSWGWSLAVDDPDWVDPCADHRPPRRRLRSLPRTPWRPSNAASPMAPTGSNSTSRKTPTARWWSHTIATSCARPGEPRGVAGHQEDLADIDIGSSFAPGVLGPAGADPAPGPRAGQGPDRSLHRAQVLRARREPRGEGGRPRRGDRDDG